jgi:hypothetical protein
MTVRKLATFPLHLGLGATAVPQPAIHRRDGLVHGGYGDRHDGDDAEGRLVSHAPFQRKLGQLGNAPCRATRWCSAFPGR